MAGNSGQQPFGLKPALLASRRDDIKTIKVNRKGVPFFDVKCMTGFSATGFMVELASIVYTTKNPRRTSSSALRPAERRGPAWSCSRHWRFYIAFTITGLERETVVLFDNDRGRPTITTTIAAAAIANCWSKLEKGQERYIGVLIVMSTRSDEGLWSDAGIKETFGRPPTLISLQYPDIDVVADTIRCAPGELEAGMVDTILTCLCITEVEEGRTNIPSGMPAVALVSVPEQQARGLWMLLNSTNPENCPAARQIQKESGFKDIRPPSLLSSRFRTAVGKRRGWPLIHTRGWSSKEPIKLVLFVDPEVRFLPQMDDFEQHRIAFGERDETAWDDRLGLFLRSPQPTPDKRAFHVHGDGPWRSSGEHFVPHMPGRLPDSGARPGTTPRVSLHQGVDALHGCAV
ncbi:hypothetical protein OQA88_4463 [Cercophora sp. LCS_1]